MTNKLILLLVLAGALILTAVGADRFGHRRGINEQKAIDQVLFDQVNQDLTKQKGEAASTYRKLGEILIAKQAEADAFKTQLEKNRAKDQATIDGLRRDYAARGLRFAAPTQAAGCGGGGGSTQGPPTQTASTDAPAIVELPRKITDDLRQLTFEGDALIAEYRKCFDWANAPVNR